METWPRFYVVRVGNLAKVEKNWKDVVANLPAFRPTPADRLAEP